MRMTANHVPSGAEVRILPVSRITVAQTDSVGIFDVVVEWYTRVIRNHMPSGVQVQVLPASR